MPITITTNGGKLPKNRVSTLNVIWYGWLSRAPAIKHLANQFSPASLKVRLVAQWAKWLLAFLLHVFVRPQSRLNQSMLHNASENVPDTSVWEVLVVPWIDKRGFYSEKTNKHQHLQPFHQLLYKITNPKKPFCTGLHPQLQLLQNLLYWKIAQYLLTWNVLSLLCFSMERYSRIDFYMVRSLKQQTEYNLTE